MAVSVAVLVKLCVTVEVKLGVSEFVDVEVWVSVPVNVGVAVLVKVRVSVEVKLGVTELVEVVV